LYNFTCIKWETVHKGDISSLPDCHLYTGLIASVSSYQRQHGKSGYCDYFPVSYSLCNHKPIFFILFMGQNSHCISIAKWTY